MPKYFQCVPDFDPSGGLAFCQALLSSLEPQLKLRFGIFPLCLPPTTPPRKVFKAQVKHKLQPQMAKFTFIAKLSSCPTWLRSALFCISSTLPSHRTPPVVVDSKLQLRHASSFGHNWLSKQPKLVGS